MECAETLAAAVLAGELFDTAVAGGVSGTVFAELAGFRAIVLQEVAGGDQGRAGAAPAAVLAFRLGVAADSALHDSGIGAVGRFDDNRHIFEPARAVFGDPPGDRDSVSGLVHGRLRGPVLAQSGHGNAARADAELVHADRQLEWVHLLLRARQRSAPPPEVRRRRVGAAGERVRLAERDRKETVLGSVYD